MCVCVCVCVCKRACEQEMAGEVDFKILRYTEIIRTIEQLHARHPVRLKLALDLGYVDESAVTMVVSEEELRMLQHYRPKAKLFLVSNIHEVRLTVIQPALPACLPACRFACLPACLLLLPWYLG